jgi:hypothetical protein
MQWHVQLRLKHRPKEKNAGNWKRNELKFKRKLTTFCRRILIGVSQRLLYQMPSRNIILRLNDKSCHKIIEKWHSANLGWFRRPHQTSAVWQYLICVSALHLWYGCRRFTASDKHNAVVVLRILKGYENTHVYSLNLIDYHISIIVSQ